MAGATLEPKRWPWPIETRRVSTPLGASTLRYFGSPPLVVLGWHRALHSHYFGRRTSVSDGWRHCRWLEITVYPLWRGRIGRSRERGISLGGIEVFVAGQLSPGMCLLILGFALERGWWGLRKEKLADCRESWRGYMGRRGRG